MKSRRNKNKKYFNKVGYMGDFDKEIPRWAANNDETLKIKVW